MYMVIWGKPLKLLQTLLKLWSQRKNDPHVEALYYVLRRRRRWQSSLTMER